MIYTGCYYYLHAAGYVIPVFDGIVKGWAEDHGVEPEEFFNAPHIVKHWRIYTKEQYNAMMKEIDEIWYGEDE